MQYKSKNHIKFLLQYHIIFVAKYRKGIFANEIVRNRTKAIMAEIANEYDFLYRRKKSTQTNQTIDMD